MTESVRYIIQDFGGWFNDWTDRDGASSGKNWYKTLAEAKKAMPTPYERKSRVIKRVITEEVLASIENTPPAPKYKVGDTVRTDWQSSQDDGQHYVISEVIADSFWTDGHRWNYRGKGVGCEDSDPKYGIREYELYPYTVGGVKPKEYMRIVCLVDDAGHCDITKGQVYTVRKIWADGKVEIEDDEEDIVYLMPDQYRLTV